MATFPRARNPKDPALEDQLRQVNERLSSFLEVEDACVDRPVLLIVGHQRCGSTPVYQYLASRYRVGYPSNVVARFWLAPVVGVALERALRRHLGDLDSSFRSELGTTESALDPHEFSYFWNHWFPEDRRCRDADGFYKAIANMERAFGRPLLFKNVFNSLRVDLLAELLPTAVFLRVRRDLVDVACSTLEARRRRYGTDEAWIGIRPAELADVSGMSPIAQIAAQLFHADRSLGRAFATLDGARALDLGFAEFCRDPRATTQPLAALGIDERDASLPARFTLSRASLGHPEAGALRTELRRYFSDDELAAGVGAR